VLETPFSILGCVGKRIKKSKNKTQKQLETAKRKPPSKLVISDFLPSSTDKKLVKGWYVDSWVPRRQRPDSKKKKQKGRKAARQGPGLLIP
jgi:hypothetical protein